MGWRLLARGQGAVITREQLRSFALNDRQISRMAGRGELARVSAGVFLVGGAPFTTRAQLWAAVLATRGTLGLTTAGRLWGVVDQPDSKVHVLVAHTRRVEHPSGVVIHRRTLPVIELAHRSGLPVTPRRDTVLDLIATLPPAQAQRLADRGVQRGWIGTDDIQRRLRDRPHHPGNGQLRRLAPSFADGAAAHSERVLHRLLRSAGICGWVPNYAVWMAGELVAVVDVALPERGLAIEVDGMAFHVDVDRFRRDRSRQNDLVALGWTVLRFTWADLTERPGHVVATIRRLAA